MIDSHTHLQPHGAAPPLTRERLERYVAVARERGLDGICVTEHLFRFEEAYRALYGWWDDDPSPELAALAQRYWQDHATIAVAEYVRLVEDAKRDGLPVWLGIELDWLRGREETLRAFLAPYDWDIVVGSVHYIGAWGFDSGEFAAEWERRDVAQAWADYGALVAELAASGLADVIAHPDLPKVLGHRPADETPLHRTIVEAAAKADVAVELNSNGLNKPCREMYPAPALLARAHGAGLAITLASDAHTPERVGESFDALVAAARLAGYREAVSFAARRRVVHELG